MDPLGLTFENYDDFGRYRTMENLEHPDNLIKAAERGKLNSFGASLAIYRTLPVDPRGVLEGTGDPKLDGEVTDAAVLAEDIFDLVLAHIAGEVAHVLRKNDKKTSCRNIIIEGFHCMP